MRRQEVVRAARQFRVDDAKAVKPRKKRKVKADKNKGEKWYKKREDLTRKLYQIWHLNRGIVEKMAELDRCWFVNRTWLVIPYKVEHRHRDAVLLRVRRKNRTLFDMSKSAYDEFIREATEGDIEMIDTADIKQLSAQ